MIQDIIYITCDFGITTQDDAEIIKVRFDDGRIAFYIPKNKGTDANSIPLSADYYAAKSTRNTAQARAAVKDYENELTGEYEKWAKDAATQLAGEDDSKREELLAALLLLLLRRLKKLGHDTLPSAADIALGEADGWDEVYSLLGDTIDENDQYLTDSLMPDIRAKLGQGLKDPDLILDDSTLGSMLGTFASRVGLYAGAWWLLYNAITGMKADKDGRGILWVIDPQSHHCHDCATYGSVEGVHYDSWADLREKTGGKAPADGVECGGRCNCAIIPDIEYN